MLRYHGVVKCLLHLCWRLYVWRIDVVARLIIAPRRALVGVLAMKMLLVLRLLRVLVLLLELRLLLVLLLLPVLPALLIWLAMPVLLLVSLVLLLMLLVGGLIPLRWQICGAGKRMRLLPSRRWRGRCVIARPVRSASVFLRGKSTLPAAADGRATILCAIATRG